MADSGKVGLLLVVGDRDAAFLPGFLTRANGGVVDVATEHQHTLKFPLLFQCGLEFALEGLAYCLLVHVSLFCPIGAKVVAIRTFVALLGHPAFIPMPQRRGLSPVLASDRRRRAAVSRYARS